MGDTTIEIAVVYKVMQILENEQIKFRLARDRPDTMRIDATLVGLRLEIECFDDNHVEVSTFKGTEGIDGELDYLLKMLAENPMD